MYPVSFPCGLLHDIFLTIQFNSVEQYPVIITTIMRVSWPSGLVHWTHGSGIVRTWVRIPACPVAALVSLSKTLNHNCFVPWMGHRVVGPVRCAMLVKKSHDPCHGVSGFAVLQGGYGSATNLLYCYYYYAQPTGLTR